MPSFGDAGGLDDAVRLTLGKDTVKIAEGYHIRASVFEQPESWSLTLGWGDVVAQLLAKYPPRTPFSITIGTVPTQSGVSDGFDVNTSVGASEVTFEGRDVLGILYDDHHQFEKSYENSTYSDLVRTQLKEVGLDPNLLVTSATADRQIRAGVPLVELAPPVVVDEILQDPSGQATTGVIQQAIKNHLGERRLMFIRRYLDRAGLFLRASNDGHIILSAPNPNQKPVARIIRRRGDRPGPGNVLGSRFRNNTRTRYSQCVLYGRGGGKRYGRAKMKGGFADAGVIHDVDHGGDVYAPMTNTLVIRDANVQTPLQAELLAARKLAEGRRAGWSISYTLSGHTTPSLITNQRCVWTPDTVVAVDDDEYGIHGNFYVESCEYSRRPQTETEIRLMRIEDLVFGEED